MGPLTVMVVIGGGYLPWMPVATKKPGNRQNGWPDRQAETWVPTPAVCPSCLNFEPLPCLKDGIPRKLQWPFTEEVPKNSSEHPESWDGAGRSSPGSRKPPPQNMCDPKGGLRRDRSVNNGNDRRAQRPRITYLLKQNFSTCWVTWAICL